MKINEETKLEELFNKKYENILRRFGVPCLTCPFAKMEAQELELGQICEMYNINKKELIKELNKI